MLSFAENTISFILLPPRKEKVNRVCNSISYFTCVFNGSVSFRFFFPDLITWKRNGRLFFSSTKLLSFFILRRRKKHKFQDNHTLNFVFIGPNPSSEGPIRSSRFICMHYIYAEGSKCWDDSKNSCLSIFFCNFS